MDYEFFFLRYTGCKKPRVLRVIAPTYAQAVSAIARRFGWTAQSGNKNQMNRYLRAFGIHPIAVQNVFLKHGERMADRLQLSSSCDTADLIA